MTHAADVNVATANLQAMMDLLAIVYEDPEVIIINKPAGLVCHPTKAGPDSSLIGRLRLYLGPGQVPRMVNRLDRETSGLVMVAKSARTASELGNLWALGLVQKEYSALVHGAVSPNEGIINGALGPDLQSAVAVKSCLRADGAAAETRYRVALHFRQSGRDFSLLSVWPLTGRKHQIRVHLQSIGHPIVGDKLYGSDERLYLALAENRLSEEDRAELILPYQALHAGALNYHWRGAHKSFAASPEEWFVDFYDPRRAGWHTP